MEGKDASRRVCVGALEAEAVGPLCFPPLPLWILPIRCIPLHLFSLQLCCAMAVPPSSLLPMYPTSCSPYVTASWWSNGGFPMRSWMKWDALLHVVMSGLRLLMYIRIHTHTCATKPM